MRLHQLPALSAARSTDLPCFVQYPSKAPRHQQSLYKRLNKAYKAGPAKDSTETDIETETETETAIEEEENGRVGLIQAVQDYKNKPAIWFDSGADDLICPDRSLFVELKPCHRRFRTATGTPLNC